jgi:hypothetical protein
VTRFEFALFNSNMVDKLARRTMIVLQDVVGQTIGDEPIIFQDSEGRIYVPIDPRPVVSRANIGAERVWGIEGLFMRNLGTSWRLVVKGGMQRGHEQETDNWVRKLAPDNLTTSLRWSDVRGRLWLEGLVQVYAAQNRFNPFDYDDARIGAYRDAGTIAGFWNNAAMRLGLIEDGILTVTGETLDEVILRVLGPTLEGNSLFTETPGFVSVGVRGGVAINDTQSLTFGVMNVADSNYRLHGSGVDAPGINATVAYEANF